MSCHNDTQSVRIGFKTLRCTASNLTVRGIVWRIFILTMSDWNRLNKIMFDIWMSENHPWFNTIVGLLAMLIGAIGILSLIFVLFFTWWWKMLIVCIAAFGLLKAGAFLMIFYYAEKYKEDK